MYFPWSQGSSPCQMLNSGSILHPTDQWHRTATTMLLSIMLLGLDQTAFSKTVMKPQLEGPNQG